MTIRTVAISMGVLALYACRQTAADRIAANQTAPLGSNQVALPAPEQSNATANVSLPDDRTPLEEPKGPIDPKSAEAAGQVIQHYAALIEQGRWKEGGDLWGDPDSAEKFRATDLARYPEVHLEIGKPGDMEGAAGSSYITVPTVFYGKTEAGGAFRRAADMILRRVNDVPGSTEAQRRWHIERIEWKSAA